jgi:hypothetical protein
VDDLHLVLTELATLTTALRDHLGLAAADAEARGAADAALHGAADRLIAAAAFAAIAHRVMVSAGRKAVPGQ